MKIELKNIGTVKHAEIDLDKNLLIFCGPNNSGKTYVAYTLYGVYKSTRYSLNTNIRPNLTDNNEYLTFNLSPQLVRDILHERGSTVRDDLGYIFSSNQYFFNDSEILIDVERTDDEINEKIDNFIIEDYHRSLFGSTYAINKSANTNFISIKGISTYPEKADKKRIEFENNNNCTLIIKDLVTGLFYGNAYIAPAERIAINIFSKELSLSRGISLDRPFIKDDINNKSRYSIPINACLRIAEDLQYLSSSASHYSFLAELFEERILKGNISISQYGAMQFSPADSDIKDLDIHLSGSMVKSLSSLVFYFRHLAYKGDFIIIDEPELNLHPDNQIIMARILARIVNAGFKVLISTHSDYIISELNNLVRLHSEKERAQEIMQKYGYTKDELLDKDSLGVYLFKDNTAKSLEVDELGFGVSTIEKVNSELSQISESIYFDLFDKDDE